MKLLNQLPQIKKDELLVLSEFYKNPKKAQILLVSKFLKNDLKNYF